MKETIGKKDKDRIIDLKICDGRVTENPLTKEQILAWLKNTNKTGGKNND